MMCVFIKGKQKFVPRPRTGISEEEAFIRTANDPSLMIEYGYWDLLAEYEAANRLPCQFDDEGPL